MGAHRHFNMDKITSFALSNVARVSSIRKACGQADIPHGNLQSRFCPSAARLSQPISSPIFSLMSRISSTTLASLRTHLVGVTGSSHELFRHFVHGSRRRTGASCLSWGRVRWSFPIQLWPPRWHRFVTFNLFSFLQTAPALNLLFIGLYELVWYRFR